MQRKTYCPQHSDFKSYYLAQAGKGFSDIEVFRGTPYQRGYGLGSLFKRFAIPILKFLGKQAVKTGIGVGQDYLENKSLKQSLKERSKEGLKNIANTSLAKASEMLNQTGTGIKRKKRSKRRVVKRRKVEKKRLYKKAVKRKIKDIFG